MSEAQKIIDHVNQYTSSIHIDRVVRRRARSPSFPWPWMEAEMKVDISTGVVDFPERKDTPYEDESRWFVLSIASDDEVVPEIKTNNVSAIKADDFHMSIVAWTQWDASFAVYVRVTDEKH